MESRFGTERRAHVTGASHGPRRAVAKPLMQEEAHVAICARDNARVQQTADDLGALPFVCDLTPPGSGASLAKEVFSATGGIDVLVVNTGVPPVGKFQSVDDRAWVTALEGIFLSAVCLICAALSGMRERKRGRITIVTPVAVLEPHPGLILSNAIRPASRGRVNALSREVAGEGVTVNALLRRYTLTERIVQIGVGIAHIADQVPAKRIGRAEQSAALATLEASEPSGYICGQAIACDGSLLRSI
jgi:Dehydrogenases with different specificities (related to short-chain alcohol dehydrogenases)